MSTTTIEPLTNDEARVYREIYHDGWEVDLPFVPPRTITDSISMRAALKSLIRKGLIRKLRYSPIDGGWLWPFQGRVLVTTAGEYTFGRPLQEAYQAWYESQEDDDGDW